MGKGLTRREILALAVASPVLAAFPGIARGQGKPAKSFNRQSFIYAPSTVVPAGDSSRVSDIKVIRQWKGPICQLSIGKPGY